MSRDGYSLNDAAMMLAARRRAAQDPAWFYKHILCFPILPWQLQGVQAALDVGRKARGEKTVTNHQGLPRITARSCHGTGKTQWLALLAHLWSFCYRQKTAATAPKEAQLTRRLMPRIRTAMRDAIVDYRQQVEVLGKEVKFFGDEDWGLVLETASDPDNLAGYHDTPQLFLVDEASAKRLDPMFPVIEGALTTPGSVVVEIGNPTRMSGEFYDHHNKPGVRDLYYRMHVKKEDAPGLISQAWVDAMITKYGPDSPITLIRVFGEFASYDESILIYPDLIDEALDTEFDGDGSHPTLRVSVDVMDGGKAQTVVTAALHYATHVQVLEQRGYMHKSSIAPIKAAEVALQTFNRYGGRKNVDDFAIDANGVGAGTAGTLMKAGYRVIAFHGGWASPVDSKRFRNWRVQCAISMYDAMANGRLGFAPGSVDDEDELRAHLMAVKRADGGEKVDDIEAKEKTVKDAGFSPDRFDSMMMQYADEGPKDMLMPLDTNSIMVGATMEAAAYDY